MVSTNSLLLLMGQYITGRQNNEARMKALTSRANKIFSTVLVYSVQVSQGGLFLWEFFGSEKLPPYC